MKLAKLISSDPISRYQSCFSSMACDVHLFELYIDLPLWVALSFAIRQALRTTQAKLERAFAGKNSVWVCPNGCFHTGGSNPASRLRLVVHFIKYVYFNEDIGHRRNF